MTLLNEVQSNKGIELRACAQNENADEFGGSGSDGFVSGM